MSAPAGLGLPLKAIQQIFRGKADECRRAQDEMEALVRLKGRLMAGEDAPTMADQVLTLFAHLKDAQAVADYCNSRGWQAHNDSGLGSFVADDVLHIVEWDELPGDPVLRALAQLQLPP